MGYDARMIEQVQSLNDIVEVVSSYLPLKRGGRAFKANCPFHQEKTPSFTVNPERQIFHCFGCGEGGDVIAFVMKMEQLNFPEALRLLADRVHFELPETTFKSSQEKSATDLLYQAYELAYQFYHQAFLKSPEAAPAREYWKSRGCDEKQAVQFGIGYSFQDWRKLHDFLVQKGFRSDLLVKCGLVARSSQGTFYDWFRGRLMFPIRNSQGKVMAFGGRVIGEGSPKYLNSAESDIFKKRREFYGLNIAKSAMTTQGEIRRMLIVEGYMDCLQLQAAGFLNTVATLGTAMTEEHVRMLKRFADEAIVVYDGDKAGESAAVRGLDIFLEEGMSARAISLPSGLDPDDFVRTKGKEAFSEEIKNALDIFDFKLKVLMKRFNQADSSGLLRITSEFLDTLSKVKNDILLDRYMKRLSSSLGVEERSLRSELEKLKGKRSGGVQKKQGEVQAVSKQSIPELPYEKLLLTCLLNQPHFYTQFNQVLPDYYFQGEKSHALYQLLSQYCVLNLSEFSGAFFVNQIEESQLKNFATELMITELPEETIDQVFRDCIARMQQVHMNKRLRDIRSQIGRAEASRDQELVASLMKQYQELLSGSKIQQEKT